MKNFGIIGVGGYIAPRHLKAIKETGNNLVVALDKSDSVGIIDSFFPDCNFFTEYERFDRYVDKLRHSNNKLDYLTICTPNYLHDSHIRFGLRNNCDVICEKPIVLNPWNIDNLKKLEKETGRKVNTILQLRLHPSIIAFRQLILDKLASNPSQIFNIDLTYITSRGNWYFASWKADEEKSGGVATNIGVHFYDMLSWIFGEIQESIVHVSSFDRVAGLLIFKNAKVRYFLSIDYDTLPEAVRLAGKRTYRSIMCDNKEIEFSDGFADLHTESYKNILQDNGFGLDDARQCIEIVSQIRNAKAIGLKGDYHPLAKLSQKQHPFKI